MRVVERSLRQIAGEASPLTEAPTGAEESGEHGTPTPEAPGAEPLTRSEFNKLVTAHYKLIFSIAYQVLGNARDAEDAVQNAFLKAYRSRASLRDPKVAVGWLCRIARNAALDLGRKRGRRGRLQDELTDRAEVEAEKNMRTPDAMESDEREQIRAAIETLPESEALVVTLRFLEGLTPGEIADRLGEKPGTVRVRLHRALKRLRETMEVKAA
jgi:RNA polymerase sigma-70 factor (ECF subfamily)